MLFRGALGGGAASGKLGSGRIAQLGRSVPAFASHAHQRNTLFQQEVRNAIGRSPRNTPRPSPTPNCVAWEVYAENVTRRNRLGDSIKISGIATFVAFNTPHIQNGQTIITAAPTTFNLGAREPQAQSPSGA